MYGLPNTGVGAILLTVVALAMTGAGFLLRKFSGR
jgi:LPXTG-motif cell wall-anchored protein